jgi:hypothetical protein
MREKTFKDKYLERRIGVAPMMDWFAFQEKYQ